MKLIKPVLAQITNPVLTTNNLAPSTYVNNVIQTFIALLIIVGVLYFVINFLLAAFHMISSQGDPKKFEEAQKSVMYSILGITLLLIVFAILKIVGHVFGIAGLEDLIITWPSIN